MKLGLIGNPLGHSWSPQIHTFFLKESTYDLWAMEENELDDFFAKKDFDGINVTIPYKKTVMKYLDEIDDTAKAIGAVNCIVNDHGKLIGHNTDWTGLSDMLAANHIEVSGKRCALLGSGGASRAVRAALKKMNGLPLTVSRHPDDNQISYEELRKKAEEVQVLVNCTPLGMKPNDDAMAVDPADYPNVSAVIDVVANPLRTKFCFKAKMLGVKNLGGFEMLVRQAAAADALFTGKKIPEERIHACMNMLYGSMRSLVLIGMPTSGKSTIAKMVSEASGRKLVEMDDRIVQKIGMPIADYFRLYGEDAFRKVESDLACSLKEAGGCVISCGGGVIKNEKNMQYLSENGLIVFLDRKPELLYGTSTRPLSQNHSDIEKLCSQRLPLYRKYADVCVDNNSEISETFRAVMKLL